MDWEDTIGDEYCVPVFKREKLIMFIKELINNNE